MTGKYARLMKVSVYLLFSVLAVPIVSAAAHAARQEASCYQGVGKGQNFDVTPDHALYILVDQTSPISEAMKVRARQILADWGQPGDRIKIVGFSANFRDQYPQLYFDGRVEREPSQEYMFNLRYTEKEKLRACLQTQREEFQANYKKHFNRVLADINTKTPKTDLLYSLKLISEQLIHPDDAVIRTVFLLSDGLENSDVTSFYRRGKLRKINDKKEIVKVRRKGLVANWKNARIYVYGAGLWPKSGQYVNVNIVSSIARFWERYFVEGNGVVKAIGQPELLITSIR